MSHRDDFARRYGTRSAAALYEEDGPPRRFTDRTSRSPEDFEGIARDRDARAEREARRREQEDRR